MPRDSYLTGVERRFETDQVIVTKTDLKGRITYASPKLKTEQAT